MPKSNRHAAVHDDPRDAMSADLETLKERFSQLRDDVTKFLEDTWGTGKSGAELLKSSASSAVHGIKNRLTDLKDRGVESFEKLGHKITERPVLSAAIALGIGIVLAKFLFRKR